MKALKEIYRKVNTALMSVVVNENGQTMIEYALVAILIAIVLVTVFMNSGVNQGMSSASSKVASSLSQ